MKVWYCTSFQGHWPVGVAAVIAAPDAEAAAELLNARLVCCGLAQPPIPAEEIYELPLDVPHAVILNDGDY